MSEDVPDASLARALESVSADRLRQDLFALSKDPLPYRKLNHHRPGIDQSTLDEADDYIEASLTNSGYTVTREAVEVQAFRCDVTKPKASQYARPEPDDPRYAAHNLSTQRTGTERPDDIILFLAHKDSQSWVDSPGANDNATGTVVLLELARQVADRDPARTIRFLFCNEEHRPWTSVTAATTAKERGDALIGIFNVDSVCGVAEDDRLAGRHPSVTLYTEPPGEASARLMDRLNSLYSIGLDHRVEQRDRPGDDDGSFINAGYLNAIINIGSWPYADEAYHREDDSPERVDIDHLAKATRLHLAAALPLDRSEPLS